MGDSFVTVRIFGSLRPYRDAAGLPYVAEVPVPDEGFTGVDLAEAMSLPLDKIEGMFRNHTVMALNHPLSAGDRVAFVPYDTPGPHRFFLGLYKAGKEGHPESSSD